MTWTDTKVDNVDDLPASEYNNLVEHVYRNVQTKNSAYTASIGDVLLVSGTTIITLPSGHSAGDMIIIKNTGTNTVTIDGDGAETIDGSATHSLSYQYQSVNLVSDGSNWHII